MKSGGTIAFIVLSAVAILLTSSVLIPIIKDSTTYTEVYNRSPDGLQYAFVEDPNDILISFENHSESSFDLVYPDGSSDSMPIRNLILLATDRGAIYVTNDGTVWANYIFGGHSEYRTYQIYDLNSIEINGSVFVTHEGLRSELFSGCNWAYVPADNGNFGFYSEGNVTLTGFPYVGAAGAIGNNSTSAYRCSAYGSLSGNTIGSGSGFVSVNPVVVIDENVLKEIYWTLPGGVNSNVTPIEPVTLSDLYDEYGLNANEVGTATITAGNGPNDARANVTFFDNMLCRVNSYYHNGEGVTWSDEPSMEYNGQYYTPRILGNGSDPVIESGSVADIRWYSDVISDYAFAGNVPVPSSISAGVIGNFAFENNPNLTGQYSEYYDWVGNSAFKGTSIEITLLGERLTHIGDSAFDGASSVIVWTDVWASGGAALYTIGDSAFKDANVTFSNAFFNDISLTKIANIGDSAFENCNITLKGDSLNIGMYTTTIGDRAFANSTGFTTLNIGTNAVLGNDIFVGSDLDEVNVVGGVIPTTSQIGLNIPIEASTESVPSVGYIAEISRIISRSGSAFDLLKTIPMLIIAAIVVAMIGLLRFRD